MTRYLTDNDSDGTYIGQSTSEKIGFYGKTPIAQRSGGAQAAITDASGGTAAPTNGVLTITATYNSTIIANALATVIAQTNEIRNTLVSLGLYKGSA